MPLHVEPARLRHTGDRTVAVTGVGIAGQPSGYRTSDMLLGIPTYSARTRHGFWGLYQNGTDVVVVHPGGAMIGPPAQVAAELGGFFDARDTRSRRTRPDGFDRAALIAILGFLTGPDTEDEGVSAARGWSSPAKGYWLSGPFNQPGHGHQPPSSWPGAPARRHDPESDEGIEGHGPEARPVSTRSPATRSPAAHPAAVPARHPGHRRAARPAASAAPVTTRHPAPGARIETSSHDLSDQ